jgi:Transposase/Transposase IS116/IS110/IS902 family
LIFVGVDWSEDHHDLDLRDEAGVQLAALRVGHGVEGVARLHEAIAAHADDPAQVVVGIETDRGLLVEALVAAGYRVYAVNPRSVDRYRDRHALSGAKSDTGDAVVLAEMVRTDRHHHRLVAGDSDELEGLRVLARSHQSLIWARVRHTNQLRHLLLEYYPAALAAFGGELTSRDALAVLGAAPHPLIGRTLDQAAIVELLGAGGRRRNLARRADQIHAALQSPQLAAPGPFSDACAVSATAILRLIEALNGQISRLEETLGQRFERHPDAEILRSLPGLGIVLGARVLSEFGDDPDRYADAKARRNYAGTSPITKASGRSKVVLARFVRNDRLADACDRWAFCALSASPGARRYYDELRNAGRTHRQALRALSNKLVGFLHGCLATRTSYDEHTAWRRYQNQAA